MIATNAGLNADTNKKSHHDIRFPGESPEYRIKRNALLTAEIALRAGIEDVARLRRALPLGGVVKNYKFDGADGPVQIADLFTQHETVIVYSFMFGGQQVSPCPMCSAFLDSVIGQLKHIQQRAAFVVVARNPIDQVLAMAQAREWSEFTWLSAAQNTYAVDYHSETADGAQMPMCNVFTRRAGEIRHFWNSEMFFAPSETHPRHIDLLWPLWNMLDITPEGRGEFTPKLNY